MTHWADGRQAFAFAGARADTSTFIDQFGWTVVIDDDQRILDSLSPIDMLNDPDVVKAISRYVHFMRGDDGVMVPVSPTTPGNEALGPGDTFAINGYQYKYFLIDQLPASAIVPADLAGKILDYQSGVFVCVSDRERNRGMARFFFSELCES